MGTEATQWQMFQQISLYNKKLGQNCRKGCFLKKHTDFKETSGGICNIYRAVPAEGAGLQARGRSGQAMMGACSRGLEQHLGCSKLARTVWKSSCGASNFDFTELRRGGGGCGGRHRLYSRAHVFWLMCFLPSHCGGPHSAAELNGHSRTVLLYPQGCLCGVGPRSK